MVIWKYAYEFTLISKYLPHKNATKHANACILRCLLQPLFVRTQIETIYHHRHNGILNIILT